MRTTQTFIVAILSIPLSLSLAFSQTPPTGGGGNGGGGQGSNVSVQVSASPEEVVWGFNTYIAVAATGGTQPYSLGYDVQCPNSFPLPIIVTEIVGNAQTYTRKNKNTGSYVGIPQEKLTVNQC